MYTLYDSDTKFDNSNTHNPTNTETEDVLTRNITPNNTNDDSSNHLKNNIFNKTKNYVRIFFANTNRLDLISTSHT